MTTEWHGRIGDITHFQVYRTRVNTARGRAGRRIPKGDTWRLARCAPGGSGGVESFETAELAKTWATKLNPKVTWVKVRVHITGANA